MEEEMSSEEVHEEDRNGRSEVDQNDDSSIKKQVGEQEIKKQAEEKKEINSDGRDKTHELGETKQKKEGQESQIEKPLVKTVRKYKRKEKNPEDANKTEQLNREGKKKRGRKKNPVQVNPTEKDINQDPPQVIKKRKIRSKSNCKLEQIKKELDDLCPKNITVPPKKAAQAIIPPSKSGWKWKYPYEDANSCNSVEANLNDESYLHRTSHQVYRQLAKIVEDDNRQNVVERIGAMNFIFY